MVKSNECPHASSMSADLPRLNRSKTTPLCEQYAVRLQVSNVPARNYGTAGVQGASKSLIGSVMRNVLTLSLRPVQCRAGITVRRAVGVAGKRCWKKQMPSGKLVDRV